jgi:hypothetical protein
MSTNPAAGNSPAALIPGISFDGRAYHYGQYSYDRLEDALSYAKLDRAKPGFREESAAPLQWKQWADPTTDQRAEMLTYHIAYAGGRYCYGPYRYDLLADAISYARREPGLSPLVQAGTEEARNR